MKVRFLFVGITMALMNVACTNQNAGMGIRLENMNDSMAPGTDFYQYACGGWMKNNPLFIPKNQRVNIW